MYNKAEFGLMIGATLAMAVSTVAQEKTIRRRDLPYAVEKTVAAQTTGATITGFTQETEKGETLYEVQTISDHKSRDILLNSAGEVVEVEEQMSWDTLSPAVVAGLHAQAANGKIVKVESLTKRGVLVAYEAQISNHGKHSEVQVGPDGKPLAHAE